MKQYYYIDKSGQQQGPVSANELSKYGVTRNTLVWKQGMTNWQIAGNLLELSGLLASVPATSKEMYLLGSFTSWKPLKMTRRADNKWEVYIEHINSGQYEFKFSNTTDWSGTNWGGGRDGIHTVNQGLGNCITNIRTSGKYCFIFDDNNLTYEIILIKAYNVAEEIVIGGIGIIVKIIGTIVVIALAILLMWAMATKWEVKARVGYFVICTVAISLIGAVWGKNW